MMLLLTFALALTLGLDTLRRVYSVGTTANDHFVAAVVAGCFGFYVGLALLLGVRPPMVEVPSLVAPLLPLGVVSLWGLFYALSRPGPVPRGVWQLLAVPSQVGYAFALWGGLFCLLHVSACLALSLYPIALGWPLCAALALAVWGTWHSQTRGLAVVGHQVPGLPCTVVHLSDLHASPLMHSRELGELVDRVNALGPGLVVITGDLVMPFSEQDHGYLIEALARLKAPTCACVGNHDLPVWPQLKAELEGIGIPLLVDEAREMLPGLEVVGVGFHWRHARAELEAALRALPRRAPFSVLLAHDPRLGPWVPEGRFNLVLSGHTHGGQVAGEMFGLKVSLLGALGVRDHGWFYVPGGAQYVHAGNWWMGLPPRMGVAGEIVALHPVAPPTEEAR